MSEAEVCTAVKMGMKVLSLTGATRLFCIVEDTLSSDLLTFYHPIRLEYRKFLHIFSSHTSDQLLPQREGLHHLQNQKK